jgi:RNA polymerase sigma factor (sigma-70 family)
MLTESAPDLPIGENESLERAIREHGDFMFRFFYDATGNPEDAEELLQDLWLRVSSNLNLKGHIFEFQLRRMGTSLLHRFQKKKKDNREECSSQEEKQIVRIYPSPLEFLLWKQLRSNAFSVLTQRQRECMEYFLKDSSPKEIALDLGISDVAVRGHIQHAERKMRHFLVENGDIDPASRLRWDIKKTVMLLFPAAQH